MESLSRKLSAAAAGTLLAGSLAAVAVPSPAAAAQGDASARAVVVDLDAALAGIPLISLDVTIGEAIAPSDGGTDSSTALDLGVGDHGIVLDGTVAEVSATRGHDESSAAATVTDLELDLLEIDVLRAELLSAAATCPAYGAQQAETTIVDLELLGELVTLDAESSSVDANVGVDLRGLLSAQLKVALNTTETTTHDGATAIAVTAEVALHAALLGIELPIDVGSVILAEAICERPI